MPGKYYGKYTGIVTDNRDPDKLGKLTVSVPAIFPEEEHAIAQPALPYGYFFVPEVGTKVWIEFEGGDPGLPLWTGVRYVPGEWAAEAEADPPELRVIKTAAGHLVVFNDKKGEAKIEIRDGVNGHVITLSADGVTIKDGKSGHELATSAQGVTLKDGVSGHELAMSAEGVKIKNGTAKLTVDAGPGIVEVLGSVIKLSSSAALPILRVTDQGVGNLGAPVPMIIGPGNPTVLG